MHFLAIAVGLISLERVLFALRRENVQMVTGR
jgi:hypothetical protein